VISETLTFLFKSFLPISLKTIVPDIGLERGAMLYFSEFIFASTPLSFLSPSLSFKKKVLDRLFVSVSFLNLTMLKFFLLTF
jgi:hypothetical protein